MNPTIYNISSNINPLLNDVKFQQFLNCGQIAILYLDKTGVLLYATPFIEDIVGSHGLQFGDAIDDTELVKNCPALMEKITDLIKCIQEAETTNNKRKLKSIHKNVVTMETIGVNGIIYEVIIYTYLTVDNNISGLIINFHDISRRKSTEKTLELEKVKYKLIAELTDCALWEYDIAKKEMRSYNKLKGKYANVNLNMEDFRNFIISRGYVHPEDLPIFIEYCDSMDRGDAYLQYELRAMGDNREYIWVRYQGASLRDTDGKNYLIVGRTINIDKEHKEYDKLLHNSQRDALTGLYNRNATKEKIEKCFKQTKDKTDLHNFMIIDIDNFKKANDIWGHLFGDILLENFSKKLEEILESTDIAGRIGGDEFIVLQKYVQSKEQIATTARLICDMTRKYMKGMMVEDNITVSIGIATYPEDGNNYDALYRKADIALYYAKSQGKDQYAFYEPELEKIRRMAEPDSKHWIHASLIDQTTPETEKRLLNYAVDIVNRSTDFDMAIKKILQETGKYYDLSRIVIFENQFRNTQSKMSYEWLNNGVSSAMVHPLIASDPLLIEFLSFIKQNSVYYFNDIDTADINPNIHEYYKSYHIKSLVQCAIYEDDKFVGIISYEDCVAARSWDKSELDNLFTMTKLISTYIIQLKNKNELDNELFFTQATLSNQKLCNYAVKEGTYQLLYFSEYTKKQYPNIAPGELCYQAIYGRNLPCDPCPLMGLTERNNTNSLEAYNSASDSWYSSTASSLISPDGEAIQVITTSDVTSFIERVNSKDPMTGLLTLSKFEVDGMKLIVENRDTNYYILYCDFNKFKNINDEWGYSIGNEILIHFAEKASELMKENELFCRITADIFIMLLSYKSKEETLTRIHHSFMTILKDFKKSFPGINLVLISGIYFLTKEDKVLSLAIDRANVARKTIKGIHKSSFAIYDTHLHDSITKENMIENNMHNALKNNEFVVFLQPKVDLASSKIIGAEALVRWKLSSGKLMSPNEFIPVFERNGFISELDFYVYEETFRTLRKWIDLGKQPVMLSLNVSRIHLNDSNFMNRLDLLLEKYNISPKNIELEITESMFLNDLDRLIFFVNNLRKRGFYISIDDFGSGYSSLNLLKTLPIDILKLDREFFMGNAMGIQDKIIISGIISLAKGLGLQVISEGVETVEQLEFLKESQCDMVQGYLFYKPMPMEEFVKLLD